LHQLSVRTAQSSRRFLLSPLGLFDLVRHLDPAASHLKGLYHSWQHYTSRLPWASIIGYLPRFRCLRCGDRIAALTEGGAQAENRRGTLPCTGSSAIGCLALFFRGDAYVGCEPGHGRLDVPVSRGYHHVIPTRGADAWPITGLLTAGCILGMALLSSSTVAGVLIGFRSVRSACCRWPCLARPKHPEWPFLHRFLRLDHVPQWCRSG